MADSVGCIYLLHFDQPFGHARHYLGWASDLNNRLRHHENGTGANLLKHARAAGVTWRLVRTWPGDRALERQLHNGGHARRCPECKSVRRLTAALGIVENGVISHSTAIEET